MQEQSHATREDNATLKTKLTKAETKLEATLEDLDALKNQKQNEKGQREQIENDLTTKLRWQESKVSDLQG